MQYTIRDVPKDVDKALRKKARAEGRSLNDVALEALRQGTGVGDRRVKKRDLSSITGTWVHDPETEAALREQDQIDPELWR
jgi:plasmid stability protein